MKFPHPARSKDTKLVIVTVRWFDMDGDLVGEKSIIAPEDFDNGQHQPTMERIRATVVPATAAFWTFRTDEALCVSIGDPE